MRSRRCLRDISRRRLPRRLPQWQRLAQLLHHQASERFQRPARPDGKPERHRSHLEILQRQIGQLAAGYVLAGFLQHILDTHPRVHIRVRVLPLEAITNPVATGEADLALGYNLNIPPALRIVASRDLHLGAVVAPGHPLIRRRPLWLGDCLQFPVVLADASMTIRPVVDLASSRANIAMQPTIERGGCPPPTGCFSAPALAAFFERRCKLRPAVMAWTI